jgi:hypothetical protein
MADALTAGGNGIDGSLALLGADGQPILTAKTAAAGLNDQIKTSELTVGGPGRRGTIRLLDADGRQSAVLDGSSGGLNLGGRARDAAKGHIGRIAFYRTDNENTININAGNDRAEILLGWAGTPGYVQLANGPGDIVELSAERNSLSFGTPGMATSKAEIVGTDAAVLVGGENVNGSVVVRGGDGNQRIAATAGNATLRVGGAAVAGTVDVRAADGTQRASVTAADATVRVGGATVAGRLDLRGADGTQRVSVTAADATLRIGGNGANGTVSVLGADGQPLLELLGRGNESVMGLGQVNRPGRISLFSGNQSESLRLDAATGDIMLANADYAEEFDLAEAGIEPGTVVVLTEDGSVAASEKAYDTRVAGVISGAGSYRPGLVLDRRDTGRDRAPVSLLGKVCVLADATDGPIAVGDLLTTALTPGHVMAVTEPERAFGAVVGKALEALPSGRGLIPVLVTLR